MAAIPERDKLMTLLAAWCALRSGELTELRRKDLDPRASTARSIRPEAAGRPDAHWHDLRHTGAVLAAPTDTTLAELMARLATRPPLRRCCISTRRGTATR